VEEWLSYAPPESLAYYNFVKPRAAKKLYFDVIPRAVDEYLQHLAAYAGQEADKQLENPAWHIHGGQPPGEGSPISFALLLNLASAASAHDKDVLWGFIGRYVEGATPQSHPLLDRLAGHAVKYFEDFVFPTKAFRAPTEMERAAMEDLLQRLETLDPQEKDAEVIQTEVFSAGKSQEFENLRDWFKALYEVLLGQSQGPRFGSFAAIYGVQETAELVRKGLSGALYKA
jgi:lysyl-tRNA synthetase class 1